MDGRKKTYLTSPRLRDTFIEMWNTNQSYRQISETLYVPLAAVKRVAMELGLTERKRGRPTKNHSQDGQKVGREKIRAAHADFMRRQGLRRQGVRVEIQQRPTKSFFGAPIRELSHEDQQLIEEFERAQKRPKRRRLKRHISKAPKASTVDDH